MAIRAYRVKEIKTEERNSFNLWLDEKLVAYLERNTEFYDSLDMDCCGLAEVKVSVLKEILSKAASLELDEETVRAIEEDIAHSEYDYVQYYCY